MPIRAFHLAVAAVAMSCAAGFAGGAQMRATIDQPAVVSVPQRVPGVSGAATKAARLVVTVVGYTPSPDGPVTAVVALRCGGEDKEIGRFGVFPDRPFTPAQPDRIQQYGFDVPACSAPAFMVVTLEPVLGNGREATLDVGKVALEQY